MITNDVITVHHRGLLPIGQKRISSTYNFLSEEMIFISRGATAIPFFLVHIDFRSSHSGTLCGPLVRVDRCIQNRQEIHLAEAMLILFIISVSVRNCVRGRSRCLGFFHKHLDQTVGIQILHA